MSKVSSTFVFWAQDVVRRFFRARGYEIVRHDLAFSSEEMDIIQKVRPFTATSMSRIAALVDSVKYVVRNDIRGEFVECGVWRGGSMMAAAFALRNLKETTRGLYLFDTFEGMTPPTDKDVMFDGTAARDLLAQAEPKEGAGNYWCIAGIEDVRNNMRSTQYPEANIHLVKGPVEQTIPAQAPAKIALLRLDTDWYESTKHELEHLYDRLVPNGVLIIDDYGHWQGARQAVDEFFAKLKFRPLMHRVDYSGRIVIKPGVGN